MLAKKLAKLYLFYKTRYSCVFSGVKIQWVYLQCWCRCVYKTQWKEGSVNPSPSMSMMLWVFGTESPLSNKHLSEPCWAQKETHANASSQRHTYREVTWQLPQLDNTQSKDKGQVPALITNRLLPDDPQVRNWFGCIQERAEIPGGSHPCKAGKHTHTEQHAHKQRERDGGDAEEDWRTMTVRALLVNVLMTNNFSHSIFLHHPRGQRG